jgi:hypothetical protein
MGQKRVVLSIFSFSNFHITTPQRFADERSLPTGQAGVATIPDHRSSAGHQMLSKTKRAFSRMRKPVSKNAINYD